MTVAATPNISSRWLAPLALLFALTLAACEGGDDGPYTIVRDGGGDLPAVDLPAVEGVVVADAPPDSREWACNNNAAEGKEKCDGKDLRGKTCKLLGYFKGTLSCKKDCTWELSKCSNCGNKQLDPEENCDGALFGTWSCKKLGYLGGSLTCTDCTLHHTNCHKCGNNKVDLQGEFCDGTDLQGKTCKSFGYKGGIIKCTTQCTWDAKGCF